MTRRLLPACLLVLGVVVLPAVADPPLPSPGVSAPGVDVPCAPSRAHPTPVLLVHGTRSDKTVNWQVLGPALVDNGYCVYSVDLPDRGQAPLVEALAVVVERAGSIVRETRARRISIVGHSVGGLVARDYVKHGGRVDDVITMGTPHFGYYSEPPGDVVDGVFNTGCASCLDQQRGSSYLRELNGGDPTPGRTSYTSLITEQDEIALPLESQYLPVGRQVTNVLLQQACPDHVVDHLALAIDPLVRDWVLDALSHAGPANPDRPVAC